MSTLCITLPKLFNSYPLNSHFTWLFGEGFVFLISLKGSGSLGYSPTLISFISLAQTMELNCAGHLKETSFQAAVTGDWCDSEQLSKTSALFIHQKTRSCRGNILKQQKFTHLWSYLSFVWSLQIQKPDVSLTSGLGDMSCPPNPLAYCSVSPKAADSPPFPLTIRGCRFWHLSLFIAFRSRKMSLLSCLGSQRQGLTDPFLLFTWGLSTCPGYTLSLAIISFPAFALLKSNFDGFHRGNGTFPELRLCK